MSTEMVPVKDIKTMADVMGKTKMFGKTPEELMSLMFLAQAEGKHPATVAMEYDIIQGRPALNSRSALARFQSAGGSIEWKERTDARVTAVFSHPAGGSLEISWDMARAAAAGLGSKPTWKQYPRQMLSARVIAEGVRAVFPACLSGMYLEEEVREMGPRKVQAPRETAPMRNVTPAREEPASSDMAHEDVPAKAEKAPADPLRAKVLSEIKEIVASGDLMEHTIQKARADAKGASVDRLSEILFWLREEQGKQRAYKAEMDAAANAGFEEAAQ